MTRPEDMERWKLGQTLRHPAGSEWVLIEHIGGEHDDWRGRCVVGTARPNRVGGEVVGNERTFHREYMDRTFTVVTQPPQPQGKRGDADASVPSREHARHVTEPASERSGAGSTTRWRTGQKLSRTLYAQLGPEPSEDDPFLGIMETAELADRVVGALNAGAGSTQPECDGSGFIERRDLTGFVEARSPCPGCPRCQPTDNTRNALSVPDQFREWPVWLCRRAPGDDATWQEAPGEIIDHLRKTGAYELVAVIPEAEAQAKQEQAEHRESELLREGKELEDRADRAEAQLQRERERLAGDEARRVVIDFLDAWRFCPLASTENSPRPQLQDAAKQLLAALSNESEDSA